VGIDARRGDVKERIAVIGLGYVGLPVALAFARKFPGTVGFDINEAKVAELKRGFDRNGEVSAEELKASGLEMTTDLERMRGCTFFVVAVPTPVDVDNRPDLSPVVGASETVARVLSKGSVVVYESTVYPGVTEDVCGPILEKRSGLKRGSDFFLGYSPERINPGDREHTLERIVKVVSGENDATLDRVAQAYGAIVEAGVYRAESIKVAEAAKVIENTQRDLNIALMNELALIFDRMGIRTTDVLAAAGTKWNFLKFKPGLVGGHCIGVDPYYLTTKAEQLGYQPQVILAGRRINNSVGPFVAQKLVKMLIHGGTSVKGARVGVLGLTFKENVSDLRNSKVPDIINELKAFGIEPIVHDPMGSPEEARHEYGLTLTKLEEFVGLDALVLAVGHKAYLDMPSPKLLGMVKDRGILIDVKSVLKPSVVLAERGIQYWSL
jgi:UDP-N-acetyl-D-glucosamine/UDP-N-acetyl-D-galactosamine dehydrogenase